MRRAAILLALVLAVTGSAVSCGEDRPGIAAEVANEWVQDSIDTISETIVELLLVAPALRDLLENVPSAKTLLAGIVADQVRDKIAWAYSTPTPQDDVIYRVTATAAVEFEIDLPLVEAWPYAVTLPFHLLIDTNARTVQDWSADFDNAAVASY